MRTTSFWEKSLQLTVKIHYTGKNEIDRENPGFLRKRPPFQNPGNAHVNA
jgi:hypothetical protein